MLLQHEKSRRILRIRMRHLRYEKQKRTGERRGGGGGVRHKYCLHGRIQRGREEPAGRANNQALRAGRRGSKQISYSPS